MHWNPPVVCVKISNYVTKPTKSINKLSETKDIQAWKKPLLRSNGVSHRRRVVGGNEGTNDVTVSRLGDHLFRH